MINIFRRDNLTVIPCTLVSYLSQNIPDIFNIQILKDNVDAGITGDY